MLVNRTGWKTPCAKLNLSSISNQCWRSSSHYFLVVFKTWPNRCKTANKATTEVWSLSNLKFCHKFKDCLRAMCVTVILKLKQLNMFFSRYHFLAYERHNPHDNLCLLDPPVISFDEEYFMKYLFFLYITGLMTPRWPRETHAPPTFLFSKNRKGKQRKKKKEFQSRNY